MVIPSITMPWQAYVDAEFIPLRHGDQPGCSLPAGSRIPLGPVECRARVRNRFLLDNRARHQGDALQEGLLKHVPQIGYAYEIIARALPGELV
jgi:hypothetical protein